MKPNKLILSTLSLFLLAACNGDTGDNGDNGNGGDDLPAEGEEVEGGADHITIFQSKVEISEELDALAAEYEEETGVHVEVWGTTGDDYYQQLQIQLNSDQGPSLFTIGNYAQATMLDSYIYDLSDEAFTNDIAENMAMEVDGKLIGAPYGVEGFGIIYNADLVDPADIATYDGFVNTLQEFSDTDINGFSLAQEGFFLIGHISNYPFSLQDDNIEFMDGVYDGEIDFTEVEEFSAFAQLLEDIREYTNNPLDISYDAQIGNFASGQTAMIHQGNWAWGMFDDYDIDFEIGMAPMPLMDTDSLAVGVGQNWSVNSQKDEEEIQAALDFLDWMHTSETGQNYIVDDFSAIPAYTNIEAPELDPLSEAVNEYTNNGQTLPWSHDYYPSNLVINDFVPIAEEFFIDESMTGEDVVQRMYEEWMNAGE